jgi:2-polyprenyl-3-methyl-5-hydroxy-6-metoxy-1,4-benzoquinol methylase
MKIDGRWFQNKIRSINNKLFHTKAGKWDWEYSHGVWDFLHNESEVPRLETLSKMITGKPVKTILEIGSGEGLLGKYLPKSAYNHFLGIDISKEAIEKAKVYQSAKMIYLPANMETYKATESFDLVIFNECLYYANNPIKLFNRYLQFVRPSGFIITSIADHPKHQKLLIKLRKQFNCIQSETTNTGSGIWHCDVFQKT